MNEKIDRWRQGLVLVAVLVGLTGCGGGKPPPAKAPAPPSKGEEQTAAQAQSPGQERKQLQALEASGAVPALERTPMLGGIDANGDGVRDDIALHIQKTYADPVQRRAAMQTARALQQALLVDKNDAVALEEASEMGAKAIKCSIASFPGSDGAIEYNKLSQELESMTTNTKERLQAYLAYNKSRSGTVSGLPEGDACD